jgi:DNA invertase Pin-like site-specific DNA recombinase
MKRAAIYTRFSSELQDRRSCDDQESLCHRAADERNLTVVATYRDEAISSAAATNRPGYQALITAALTLPHAFRRCSG